MKLRLFNILAAVSLVMFILTIALIVRTNCYPSATGDYVEWTTTTGTRYHVRANPDGIVFFQFLGPLFGVRGLSQLRAPYWVLCVLGATFPAIYSTIYFRRRRLECRVRLGLCLACGYNLTGNISGVCPECGTAIPPKPAEQRAGG